MYSNAWSSAARAKNPSRSGKSDPFHRDPGARHALEPDLGPEDQPGEPQPADGGVEERVLRAADDALAARAQQLEPGDVRPEGAGPVVVLAVDVVGDGAAHARPSASPARPAGTSRAARPARGSPPGVTPASQRSRPRLVVERDQPVEPAHVEQQPARVEAAVAVAPAAGVGQHRARQPLERRRVGAPHDGQHPGRRRRRGSGPRSGSARTLERQIEHQGDQSAPMT